MQFPPRTARFKLGSTQKNMGILDMGPGWGQIQDALKTLEPKEIVGAPYG